MDAINRNVVIGGEPVARRTFLLDAARLAAAGFLTAELQLLVGCARDNDTRAGAFVNLTASEGRAMQAFAARIIPAENGLPGADDAGVVYFVDRVFDMPFLTHSAALIRAGLADLDARAKSSGSRRNFASMSEDEQIVIMRAIEKTPFFVAARTLVVIGLFADPAYGGNRGEKGWALLGMEHRPSNTAPFGWYDAHPSADIAKEQA